MTEPSASRLWTPRRMGAGTRNLCAVCCRFAAALLCIGWLAGCVDERDVSVYTPVTELVFADPLLRDCVRSTGREYGWDSAGRIETLHCTGREGARIRSLDGIGALINLQDLNLAHNAIQDTTPLLGLGKLVRLDLGFNEIERIDQLPRALHIDLNHNRLADLGWVSSTPTVRTLLLEHNQLEDLRPIGALHWLVELRVSGNRLVSLAGLGRSLRLQYLDASANRLADIEALRDLSELTMLELEDNAIGSLDALRGLAKLRVLDVSDNPVTDVAPLAGLVNLKQLNLSGNPLISTGALIALDELHTLGVRGMPSLPCSEIQRLVDAFGADVVKADAVCGPSGGT